MWILILIIIAAAVMAVIIAAAKKKPVSVPGARRAGMRGEKAARDIIESVLREGDYLFSGVEISYEDRPAECDNIIVNRYGVYIIEVKNWKGRLYGSESDKEWKKYKDDGYGNTFDKAHMNPIRQVKRQAYILARYLESCGYRVWVNGYVMLMHGNSPVDSGHILKDADDIDRALHTSGGIRLSVRQISRIAELLDVK